MILWDCITDAKLTKFRILVNAIHIAISMDWVSGSLWDFVSGPGFGLPTLTRFFYLDDYPSLLPGLGVLDLLRYLDFLFFLSSRLCVSRLCHCELALRIGTGCLDSGQRA